MNPLRNGEREEWLEESKRNREDIHTETEWQKAEMELCVWENESMSVETNIQILKNLKENLKERTLKRGVCGEEHKQILKTKWKKPKDTVRKKEIDKS